MSLPAAIVLSSVVLAVVILYGFTKDRWPWMKIAVGTGGLLVLVVGIVVVGIWWIDRSSTKETSAREARERDRFKVEIGDQYERVIQRQGVPDTTVVRDDGTFAIGYWDDWLNESDVEKVFSFSTDSTLILIRFIGERFTTIEQGWTPADGVELGTLRDSVRARLGQPCYEEVEDTYTVSRFPTNQHDVTRTVRVSHGEGQVIWHGWRRGGCDS